MNKPLKHGQTVAASLRTDHHIKLLTLFNDKTPKGEKHGYLQAILYMSPHTLVSPKTLCPHSTPACREGCLYTAGRGQMKRVVNARERRTRLFLDDRLTFIRDLVSELRYLEGVARAHRMKLAIRLNGTSDVRWELERLGKASIFDLMPHATFFDYSRTPIEHRPVPENWRLTWSLADAPIAEAYAHLVAGQNVAAVVSKAEAKLAPPSFMLGGKRVAVIDGDAHDLRFLDPARSLVLLSPKGRLRASDNPMVRRDLIASLKSLEGVPA